MNQDLYKEMLMQNGTPKASPKSGDDDGNVDASDNYYNLLKNESYKTMLDSEIQASIARDQAMKYTNQGLYANGYGSQGVAESTKLGIENNYRQALREAGQQYQNDMTNINQKEYEDNLAKADDSFKSISSLMSGATTQETLDKIYDYYSKDKNLDEDSKKQLEYIYSIYKDQLSAGTSDLNNYQFNLDDDKVLVTDEDGETDEVSLSGKFGAESKTLKKALATNSLPNDSYVKVEDKSGYYFFIRYYNGQLYYVPSAEYEGAKNKYSIYGYDEIKKV